jgi:MFS family permease
LAILVVEYPTNWIIQRVPIAKYLSINIILWGIALACHALAKNFTQLIVCRMLLGIFEACCQPSFIVLSSMWYKREEQTARVTYWYMMNVRVAFSLIDLYINKFRVSSKLSAVLLPTALPLLAQTK